MSYLKSISKYAEYATVCAPNSASQAISQNTLTTLEMNTEVQDGYNIGTLSSNQVTLIPGTYKFEAFVPYSLGATQDYVGMILSLYNVTDSTYIARKGRDSGYSVSWSIQMSGQFKISSTKTLCLKLLISSTNSIVSITNTSYDKTFTSSTSGEDQRTTLKLWKLD